MSHGVSCSRLSMAGLERPLVEAWEGLVRAFGGGEPPKTETAPPSAPPLVVAEEETARVGGLRRRRGLVEGDASPEEEALPLNNVLASGVKFTFLVVRGSCTLSWNGRGGARS